MTLILPWIESLHQTRGGTTTVRAADHGFGRSRGGLLTKVHQLVDGTGLPLVTAIAACQAGESPMLVPLLAELRVAARSAGPGPGRARSGTRNVL